jgi:antitoxin ParD1/3/4
MPSLTSVLGMSTMNVSLPEDLKAFVDRQVDGGGYGSTSEFVRDLLRREQDRQRLRNLLLDGAESPTGPAADLAYFRSLRDRIPTGT